MKVDSLSELKVAFAVWRRGKRYVREAVPDELMERARRVAKVHGVKDVVRAIRVERGRLSRRPGDVVSAATRSTPAVAIVPARPAFTRLELTPPVVGAQPIAELETPGGIKLRVFAESRAMLGLISSLCGVGGAA